MSFAGLSYKYIVDLILKNLPQNTKEGIYLIQRFVSSCPDIEDSKKLVEGALNYILESNYDFSEDQHKLISILRPIVTNSEAIDKILNWTINAGNSDFIKNQFYWEYIPAEKLVKIALNHESSEFIAKCAIKGSLYNKISNDDIQKLAERFISRNFNGQTLNEFAGYVEGAPRDILFKGAQKLINQCKTWPIEKVDEFGDIIYVYPDGEVTAYPDGVVAADDKRLSVKQQTIMG
jgi:hypothetical protein